MQKGRDGNVSSGRSALGAAGRTHEREARVREVCCSHKKGWRWVTDASGEREWRGPSGQGERADMEGVDETQGTDGLGGTRDSTHRGEAAKTGGSGGE